VDSFAEKVHEFQELQRLFDLLTDLPPRDRAWLLEENCKDPRLRRRVLDILKGAELPG
jgi:hypothetical protein